PPADLDQLAHDAETSLATEPNPETWYYQGSLFAYCGKKQAALHLLQSAVKQNYCAYENLLSDPLLAKLRTDVAFDKVLTAAHACQERVRASASTQRQLNAFPPPLLQGCAANLLIRYGSSCLA